MQMNIEDVIAVLYDANTKKLTLVGNTQVITQYAKRVNHLLDELCLQHGSSREGRIAFFANALNIRKKVPLLISEKYEVIWIPMHTKRSKKQVWVAYQPIKKVVPLASGCEIHFKNDFVLCVDSTSRSVKRQLSRCKTMIKLLHKI